VIGPGRNGQLASWAQVRLPGRVWLDRDDDDVVHGSGAGDGPGHRGDGQHQRSDHHDDVETCFLVWAERIQTHELNATARTSRPRRSVPCAAMSWLEFEDRDSVRTLTINRPERRNAIPPDGWEVLREAFESFESSMNRVLVLRGAGGDLCAGADLGDEIGPPSVVEGKRRMKVTGGAALALHRLSKPSIAVVDGVAVGAGMNMALGCDVVIASTRARFSEIFVKRGLTLDFGGSWLLPRVVGIQRAKDLALSGRIVEADEALRIGLCLDVVAPEDLDGRVAEQVERFLAGAPVAQMFAKQGIDHSSDVSFQDALDWEGQSQAICFTTSDFVEGVASFVQKRPPEFQGR